MSLPKLILVPTDFGEPSEAALDCALEYARAFGAAVVVLHAFEIPVMGFPDGAMIGMADLTVRLLEGAKTGLDRLMKNHAGSGVVMRSVVKEGDPWRMINETAEELGADLITMGTHGRRGLSRALIGSVVEKVVRTSKIPVLTVHVTETAPTTSRSKATAPTAEVSPPSHP